MEYPRYAPSTWVQPTMVPPIRRKWRYILLAIAIVALVSASVYIVLQFPAAGITVTSDQQAALLAGGISSEIEDINNTLTIIELAIT